MSVSIEDVHKIAALAYLEFKPDEVERLTNQLNTILQYVEKLNEIDTTSIDITYHPIKYEDVFRDDQTGDCLPVDTALQNAPKKTWQYFVVPKVVG